MNQEQPHRFRLPELAVGGTFSKEQVLQYIAQQWDSQVDDYWQATHTFPRKSERRDHCDWTKKRLNSGRAIVMEYHEFPITRFVGLIAQLRQTRRSLHDLERIDAIKALLLDGKPAFPVWIDQHLVNLDPPAVVEGKHRLMAFAQLDLPMVPVFLLKYAEGEK